MVGTIVYQFVIPDANVLSPGLSTKLTVCGAVPCAIFEVGVSLPSLKIPTILSKYWIREMSMGCMLPAPHTFLRVKYSMSAMSKPFGWVTTRCAVESVSSAVICRVMPRSSFAFSAMALMFDTPVPNWRRVTSLMFWAHTIGKPVIAPLATAAPDRAAPRLSMVRRVRVRVVFPCFGIVFLLLRPCGACGFHSSTSV